MVNTILIGLILTLISLLISILQKRIRKVKIETSLEDLKSIANSVKAQCPKCGIEFDSFPKYCYNCNSKIIIKPDENV